MVTLLDRCDHRASFMYLKHRLPWAVSLFAILQFLLQCIALAPPAMAYERARTGSGEPISWQEACVAFHVSDRGSDDVRFTDFYGVVDQAATTWSDVECSPAQLSLEGITDDETVGFSPGETNLNLVVVHEEPEDWPYDRSIIGLTVLHVCAEISGDCRFEGQILDADIELNGGYFRLSVGDPVARRGFDLLNTLTHEMGHVLGFDHSSVDDATMFEDALPGATNKRDLHQDDIDALCDVYPQGLDTGTCPAPQVSGDFFVALDEMAGARKNTGCVASTVERVHAGGIFLMIGWVLLRLGLRRKPVM